MRANYARMPRLIALAEAALAAPFSGFGDVEVFSTFSAKAGIYCARIATYHALPDGNKRTGYDVMIEFVERNGATFSRAAGGLMETADVIEGVVARTMTEADFLSWVHARISGP